MIKHVVMFKLKDRSASNVEATRLRLETLREAIEVIRSFELGADVVKSERSFDLVAIVTFDSLADLDIYQKHPAHLEILDFLNGVKDTVVAVDYES
mmetsp:Transcript_27354/g.88351  ORF Transcript_27354/g.88351 Transcript_27354/m.88351 type:complete len:96 (+) Transcript_27354:152-439(+)